MKRIILATLAAVLAISCAPKDAREFMAESGQRNCQTLVENWSFRQVGIENWMPATVPGVVHTDLLANKVIEHPYKTTNEPKLQWIEGEQWEYRMTFTPEAMLLKNDVQELVFKGLDTYSEVFLNDEKILTTDNMFLEWRVDVKGRLRTGQNELRVWFKSAYKEGLELAKKLPITLPADNDKGEEARTSVFTRKAPYHFGWDWGPRYVTVGIWRPVQLEGWNRASIANVQFIQRSQSEQLARFDAHISINAAKNASVRVILADTAGVIYAQGEFDIKQGTDNKVTLPFEITKPKLWWPNGLGEPNLYTINTIVATSSEKLDQNSQNIGIRTIRLVQEKDPVGEGESFCFEVNGKIIFAKGANYIPQDVFNPSVTADRYKELIRTTRESNMNMLRVWGGGIYEEDLFYDLCDQNGIMVWQDFMFACGFYPWDSEFLDNVRREAQYNVRRLRNHPSIAIWCGNNEIEEAWYHWGYQKALGWTEQQQKQIFDGMNALFKGVLPEVLAVEDTTRFYHPSSPLYGRGNPLSQIKGDVHYWGVFHDEEPFSVYKDKPGRFSNEYGFQSLACYDTYRESFNPEDMTLYSPAMIIHQKNPKGYRVMEEYMVRDLPLLKNDFRTYVYLTQLLQAEGIKIAMEGHRSKRPFTQGSLYWQLNDCWPVASWSSMDSEGRWKALQFYARRSFAPTILSFEKIDSSGMVKLWGLNDMLEPKEFKGTLTLMNFEGKVLSHEQISGTIPANGNLEIMHSTDKEILQKASPREAVLVADGMIDGTPVRAMHYFVPFKDLKLSKPKYEISYSQDKNKVTATIKAATLLKSVLIEAAKIQNNPSDAYFDILPGEQREVVLDFKEESPITDLGIFLTTLNDLVDKPSVQPIRQNVK